VKGATKAAPDKEIKIRPVTGENDLKIKAAKAAGFLAKGSKVKLTVFFRGRENAHQGLGVDKLSDLRKFIGEDLVAEVTDIKQQGRGIFQILTPKK